MTLTIKALGIPGPQGSKSFKGMRGGKAIMVESSKKVKPWRVAVGWAAHEAMQALQSPEKSTWFPRCGPLSVTMVFTLPRPKSAPKSRMWPDRKPDLDKLIRSTCDALTDSGVIEDDARIVELNVSKNFPMEGSLGYRMDSPGCFIEIRTI